MDNYYGYTETTRNTYSNIESNTLLGKSFLWMFVGMLISGGLAWFTYSSGLWIRMYYTGMFYVLLLVELVAVIVFSFAFRKLPAIVVAALYIIYALINGIIFSCLFAIYDLGSMAMIFAIAAIAFAMLGYIGYTSKYDLTRWRPYIVAFLITFVIIEFINLIILKSNTAQIVIDAGVLALFFGITIYDMNKIKNIQSCGYYDTSKAHIYFAMQLYLDFINIFLRMLSLFAKKK